MKLNRVKNWLLDRLGSFTTANRFNDLFVIPYDGHQTADVGMFYCPYVPLQISSSSIAAVDMTTGISYNSTEIAKFITRYGLVTVNEKI